MKEEIGSLLLALCDTYLNHDRLVSRQTTLQEIVFPSRCLIFPQIAERLTRRPILERVTQWIKASADYGIQEIALSRENYNDAISLEKKIAWPDLKNEYPPEANS